MSHIRQRALAFMASQQTITLATAGPNGLDITPYPYVLADDFDFWIIADSKSQSGQALDSASAIAGMLQGEPMTDRDDVEIRVEGSIERVRDLSEQAKAFSAFLVHSAPLPKGTRKNGESGVLAVYRVKPARVHFTAPSLLKHTAVFHFSQPAEAPMPTRAERRKVAALRKKQQAATSVRERPTLRDVNAAIQSNNSFQPVS